MSTGASGNVIEAGGLAHGLFKRRFDARKALFDRVLSLISMCGICFTILALTAPSRDTFASAGMLIVVAAVALVKTGKREARYKKLCLLRQAICDTIHT